MKKIPTKVFIVNLVECYVDYCNYEIETDPDINGGRSFVTLRVPELKHNRELEAFFTETFNTYKNKT